MLHQFHCQEGSSSTLTLLQISGRSWEVQNKHRHEYFPKPIYGSSKLQSDPLCRPSLQVVNAENIQHHHHRYWCSMALSLCWLLKLHLESEGYAGMSSFSLHLLLCSLYPFGLDCQAVLNGLELITHLDAPCQYKSVGAEARKDRLHPMPSVCFVCWELICVVLVLSFLYLFFFCCLFFLWECKTFISIYFPCRL